ncbi:MAG: hypothetical protein ACK5NK_13985 [Niabella sp.]
MVLEEISQLMEDCNVKREALAEQRDAINQSQKELLKLAAKRLEKDDLTDLEHYQNQFHIQLINIHDLKHDLKSFLQLLKMESRLQDSVSEEMVKKQQELDGEFTSLQETLQNLQNDFGEFLSKPH